MCITNTNAINLYKKCGFKEIGRTFIGQGYPIGFNRFRVIKRVVIGHGFLTKLTLGKDSRLIELQTNIKKNRETLFRICQRCMDQGWIDFFEIDADNLIKGSGRVWHSPFFRNILINDSFNSFAIIFNYPFSHKATVEVYSTSNTFIPTMLDNIMKTLSNRGIPFAQITVTRHAPAHLRRGRARRDARGSGRDPGRRAARPRDDLDGDDRRRDRAPRARHAAHDERGQDHRPHDRRVAGRRARADQELPGAEPDRGDHAGARQAAREPRAPRGLRES